MRTSRRWKSTSYLSHRMWILGALLLVLGALAWMQYRWIDRLTEAQRQRTQTNLTAALSNIESDFDVEVTRAFMTFEVPTAGINSAARYRQWLRDAPYPGLIRGVYVAESDETKALPKPVLPEEPPIRSIEWHRELSEPGPPFAEIVVSAPDRARVEVFGAGVRGVAAVPHSPEATIDGNPAFAVPSVSSVPRLRSHFASDARGGERPFGSAERVALRGPIHVREWALIVFDLDYIRSAFLPRLIERYVPGSSQADYDLVVVDRSSLKSLRVVFPFPADRLPTEFEKPDGKVSLFEARQDCFSRRSSLPGAGLAFSLEGGLSNILAQRPTTCAGPAPPFETGDEGFWEILAKYRAGSLDQAMTTFRRRNLFLSGSVLAVLALGVSMAVLLTERARALAEMQAEFILGVSHELRTPLTVIGVAADNLRKGLVDNPGQARLYGEIIQTRAVELSNMIEETLALARMRSEMILHGSLVQPEQIVNDALRENEAALKNARMGVELVVAPGLPPVHVDLHLMKQCLGNLIQNAVKYARAGEFVRVGARKVIRQGKEMVEISVEDHGPGVSQDDLPHLFEPFYRGKTTDSQIAGIGLGLTLVKRAVEAHGGAVEVESAKTTRFSIFLPSEDEQADGTRRPQG